MWLIAPALALSAPPTAEVASFPVGSGTVRSPSCDPNGETCAFVVGGALAIVEVPTWTVSTLSPCTVSAAVVVGEGEVWAGCSTGQIFPTTSQGAWLPPLVGGSFTTPFERVEALHLVGTDVQAIGTPSTGGPLQMAVYAGAQRTSTGTLSFLVDGYVTSAYGRDYLYVIHRDAVASALIRGGLNAVLTTTPPPNEIEMLAPTVANTAWALDADAGRIFVLDALSVNYGVVFESVEATAIAVSLDAADEYGLVASDREVEVWSLDNGNLVEDRPDTIFAPSSAARSLVIADSGYTFAGTSGGEVLVWTDRPWVDGLTASPATVRPGETVTVSFVVDRPGTWQVVRGGTWDRGGDVVASGSGDGAQRVDVSDGGWSEGENQIFVRHTADGRTGHAATEIVLDGPPGAVELGDDDVAPDDGSLLVTFPALDDPDIQRYTLYVSTSPFTAEAWPTGGPAYDGGGSAEAPVVETEFEAGEAMSILVSGLENGVPCYLAVRATDQGGQEGAMSEVVMGVPSPLSGAAGRAGERGGMDCDSAAGSTAGWAILVAPLLFLRRRFWGIAAASVAATHIVSAPPAQAEDEVEAEGEPTTTIPLQPRRTQPSAFRLLKPENADGTPVYGSIQVRYGSFDIVDANIGAVYRPSADIWHVEVGPQFLQFLELKAGAGFFREVASAVDDSGNAGAKDAILRALPLSLGGAVRLHVLDEQVFVPYVTGGLDWWVWDERLKSGATKTDQIWGGKFGYHYAVGGSLLLDTFAPARASLLEAQSEINDSWLTFEYRRQIIDGTQGLGFSGTLFTVGIKLDL